MKQIVLYLLAVITLAGCSRNRFLTADYDKYAQRHSRVAVLPYDIQMMGRKVAEMDPVEVDRLKTIESRLFQQSLYAEVLRRTGRGRGDIRISVQDINKTNRLLQDAGIELIDVGSYSPRELGVVLGVDAIISTRLVKEMFLSREEALLVDVATSTVLDKVPVRLPVYDRSKLTRSSEVDVYCSIVDTEEESAIWVFNTECDLQWDHDPDDAVEAINRRISRNFPYR